MKPREEVLAYFAAKAARYDEVDRQHYWRLSDQLLWDFIDEHALRGSVNPARLLDAGGGTGRWTERFLQAVPTAVGTVFDLSASMLREAHNKAARPDMRGRMSIIEGDLGRLDEYLPPNEFDVVFCFHNVIAFVEDSGQVMRQLSRVCRAGGIVLVVAPNRFHMAYFNMLVGDVGAAEAVTASGRGRFTEDMPEIAAFLPEELEALALASGLTPVRTTGYPVALYPGYAETRIDGSSGAIVDLLEDEAGFEQVLALERTLVRLPGAAARGNNLLLVATKSHEFE